MDKQHKQRIQSLWLQFLENIADAKPVVDGLFTLGILTTQLKERIMLKQGSDQLRELMDILPKRGPKAFMAFYDVLVNVGEDVAADLLCPELAEKRQASAIHNPVQVGHSEPQPILDDNALPAKWPNDSCQDDVQVKHVADSNVIMKALFEKSFAGSESVYPVHRPERGVCLLISNEYFKGARANKVELSDRDGTARDVIRLKDLFTQLHFRVVTRTNLTAEEMREAVLGRVDDIWASDNCFVCAVMTHGERGILYGTDGKELPLSELKNIVTDDFPILTGKPKLFFIQACQGVRKDSGMAAGGDASTKEIEEITNVMAGIKLRDKNQSDSVAESRVSAKSDVFCAMATIADYVSWRNTNVGTWFVQAVVYVFSHYAHNCDLNQMMTMVNKLVSKAETSRGYKQVSIFKTSLGSSFYFFPGLKRGMVETHSEVDIAKDKGKSEKAQPSQPVQATGSSSLSDSGSVTAQSTDGVDGSLSAFVP